MTQILTSRTPQLNTTALARLSERWRSVGLFLACLDRDGGLLWHDAQMPRALSLCLTVESQLGALAKRFKSLQFDAFEFQQSIALCSGVVVTILNSKEEKVKYLHHT